MLRRLLTWTVVGLAAGAVCVFIALEGGPVGTTSRRPAGTLSPVDPFHPGKTIREVHDRALHELALTTAEQAQVGRAYRDQVLADRHAVSGPALRRCEKLLRPLARYCRQQRELHLTVLDDPTINAFSHVGGYLYVHRGLLALVSSDAELQFVLAHELGHLELGHCSRAAAVQFRARQQAGQMVGALAGEAYRVVTLGYSREEEYAADAWAQTAMVRLGKGRGPGVRVMQRFARIEALGQPKDQQGDFVQQLGAHFRTHPPTEERLRRLQGGG